MINMKKSDIQDILLEAYVEVLREQEAIPPSLVPNTPAPEKKPIPQDVKLALRKVINSLFGSSHLDFVEKIQLAVPNPSEFQVFLKNGQSFYLKWMGKSPQDTQEEYDADGIEDLGKEKKGAFQAEMEGKKYFLGSLPQYEQALDKLGDLLKNGKISLGEEPGGAAFDQPSGELPGAPTGTTGAGTLPGEEAAPEAPEGEEVANAFEEEPTTAL